MGGMITTLKEKGQITIPIDVRDELGLQPGDRFAVYSEGDRIVFIRQAALVESLAGSLAQYANPNIPQDIDREEIWTEIARSRYNRLQEQEGLPLWEREVDDYS